MNKQEVFETVAKHLLTQKARAVNGIGNCRYRNPEGLKCAVGCLIKDEFYNPDLENMGASNPEVVKALKKSGIDIEDWFDSHFLKSLQIIHDRYDVIDWEGRLKTFAKNYHLKFNF